MNAIESVVKNGRIEVDAPPDWPDGTSVRVVPAIESVEQRFRRLEVQWQTDTLVLSDSGKIMSHPAMRAMIAMGEDVVPLILRDLQDKPSLLVWALPEITGENLTPPKREGGFLKWNVETAIDAWLRWGREKGLI